MFFMDKIEVLKKALGDDAIIDLKTLREEYEKAKKLVEEETDWHGPMAERSTQQTQNLSLRGSQFESGSGYKYLCGAMVDTVRSERMSSRRVGSIPTRGT